MVHEGDRVNTVYPIAFVHHLVARNGLTPTLLAGEWPSESCLDAYREAREWEKVKKRQGKS